MPGQNESINYNETSRKEQISKLIDSCAGRIKNIPSEKIEDLKTKYINDNRSYEEIEEEILTLTERVIRLEQLVSKDIDQSILEQSIILIGPMGSGKSTIASELCKEYNMPHVSLDNRNQLATLYEHQHDFHNFKEFEFYLTSMVLTNIQEPMIIDFGAGHSVYEDEAMFLEMKSLISKFCNVILLIPSEDKEESLQVLNTNKGITPGSQKEVDNRHFIDMPCNYELATIIEYTKDKTPEDISNEIINKVNQKKL